MSREPCEAGSDGQSIALVLYEQEAALIAESIEWDKVEELARRNPALAPMYAVYAGDAALRRAFHAWCGSAARALVYDTLVIAAVEVEATQPRYLELPAVLVRFAGDEQFLAARPLGRLVYRQAMYEVIEVELDEAAVKQHGREVVAKAIEEWDGQWSRQVYAPRRLEQSEVFSLLDGMVRVQDRRLAVRWPLAHRVGLAVGFLSALSISQKEEAQRGMVILAGLVAPLLSSSLTGQGEPRGRDRVSRLSAPRQSRQEKNKRRRS